MTEITLKDLRKLQIKLKNRMVILNKLKTDGHYKNDVHNRGVESFIDKFLDPFCTEHGTNRSWNTTLYEWDSENNHVAGLVKGQMKKLVVELRILLKSEGDKVLTYDILCKLVEEYYPKYKKIQEVRNKRGGNKPYDNTKRLYPGHVKLRRLMQLEEKQGFSSFQEKYFNPYGDPIIEVKLP